MQLGINSKELWETLEPKIIDIKYTDGLDQILVEKLDSIINCYNGSLSNGYQDAVLGKLEVVIKTLGSENFYRTRKINDATTKKLIDLSTDLDLFRKVLINEINTGAIKPTREEYTINKEKNPFTNLETNVVDGLYSTNGAKPRIL